MESGQSCLPGDKTTHTSTPMPSADQAKAVQQPTATAAMCFHPERVTPTHLPLSHFSLVTSTELILEANFIGTVI